MPTDYAALIERLRECAARIEADGTASQIVSAEDMRELAAMAVALRNEVIEECARKIRSFWAIGFNNVHADHAHNSLILCLEAALRALSQAQKDKAE